MEPQSSSMQAVLAHTIDVPLHDLPAGTVLIAEGPASGHLYILVEGAAEVLRGEVRVALIDEPGAVFGEISALLGRPHSATVRALSAVRVHRIDDPETFLQMRPEIVFHVARILAARLVDATSYLADVKRQFAGREDHFGMVDEVLEALVNQQLPAMPGADARHDDPRQDDPRL
jgi:CRP/FNR family cyclic AMP-dependent transcriptional regulator